jgi:ribulose-phosphate 3-epimerase
MSVVCPTITVANAAAYREQMACVVPFAPRIHIDLADGELAPTKLINPIQCYWPEDKIIDIHLMYKRPAEELETLISLKPQLVIIHAEAEGDLMAIVRQLRAVGIKSGVALLAQTEPSMCRGLIAEVDHVLVFGGKLGYQGGSADLEMLKKVPKIRAINSNVEIAWDGGVSVDNIAQLSLGGIEVLNAGGAVHHSEDPAAAYAELCKLASL